MDIANRGIILSRQRTTKALLRLRRLICPFVFFAYGINRFSHDVARIILVIARPEISRLKLASVASWFESYLVAYIAPNISYLVQC